MQCALCLDRAARSTPQFANLWLRLIGRASDRSIEQHVDAHANDVVRDTSGDIRATDRTAGSSTELRDKRSLSMTQPASLLQLLQAERDEFCRFEDYAGYHRHLTNKLHSVRKAARRQHGGDGKKLAPTPATTAADQRRVLVYSAERSWATAMHNKATGGKTAQDVLNKLRRARKWSQDLKSLVGGDAAEGERVEAIAYAEYMDASLAHERGAHAAAARHYSRALLALRDACPVLLEGIETGLRFSLYQTGTEGRSVELRVLAATAVKADEDAAAKALVDLLQTIDPSRLDTGDGTATGKGGDEIVSTIEWAGRTAPLQSTELVSSISAAVSARKHLSQQPKQTIVAEDYDALLADWTAAEALLDSLIAGEEDQDRSQTLEVVRAWARYHRAHDRVARDKLLAATAKSAREGALVWEAVRATLAQALKIPGLSKPQKAELNDQISAAQGERLVTLAKPWADSLEAVALLHTAIDRHFQPPSARRTELRRLLAKTVARNAVSSSAGSISTSSASTDGAQFSERFHPHRFFNGSVKQLVLKRSLSSGTERSDGTPHRTAAHALLTDSVPMRPVVFDVAYNYLSRDLSGSSAPASVAVPVTAAKAVEPVGQAASTAAAKAQRAAEQAKDSIMSDAASPATPTPTEQDTPKKAGGIFGFFGRR